MKVMLKNENTGQIKQAKIGFSWTVFFFGFFPAIFRGDWKWFLIILIASMFTFGFSNLVFCSTTKKYSSIIVTKKDTPQIVYPLFREYLFIIPHIQYTFEPLHM